MRGMDWRTALPRVAPMLVGVALGWVGLAMLSPFFFGIMVLIGLFGLASAIDRRRRRSEGDGRRNGLPRRLTRSSSTPGS